MNVYMIAPSLAGGGAERALLDTASMLSAGGHVVTVVTLESIESDAYQLPHGLRRLALGLPVLSANRARGLQNNLRRLKAIRQCVVRGAPDVVISYLTRTNVLCLLALCMVDIPVIVTEHNVPSLFDAPLQPLWRSLRRVLYRRAAQVVAVSHGIAAHYKWLDRSKMTVIYNFLRDGRDAGEPETYSFLSPARKYIVGMGRLSHEKGFDNLIRAFGTIESRCPDWDLLIVGEGKLRDELSALVDTLGLAPRVLMPGRVGLPYDLLRRCDIFVLSSRTEGFSMVLIEAMSVGLPVVSFDCDFGPREIISHDISGLLVPGGDVSALAGAMMSLIDDPERQRSLARRALEASERFQPSRVFPQWQDLLCRVASVGTSAGA